MAKKPQTQLEQLDTKDELLNFDIEELSGDDAQAEDEVIELVDLVESDKDEDGTRELTVNSLIKEKAAVKTTKAALIKEAGTSLLEKGLPGDEEDADLDLSDLTLDMEMETIRPAQSVGDDEITEADLENLLQDASDEEITFDLSSDKESSDKGKGEEVTDADLEALLQEATAKETGETEEEVEILEVISITEPEEEVRLEEEKPSLTDTEFARESVEKTQTVTEPLAERQAPLSAQGGQEEPIGPEEPARKDIALEEPSSGEPLTGISEERLEQIITKVVQDVVERVARETMASVAERVIGQAIEALKVSLETSSEES